MSVSQHMDQSDPLFTSANVANAALPATIVDGLRAAWPGARCVGPAKTVLGIGGDNLALYRVLDASNPGDVLVADLAHRSDFGHWGDLLSRAAMARGVAGLVIAGGIRDRLAIAEMGFPVFHSGCSPRTAAKKVLGQVDAQLAGLGDMPIASGDMVVADDDGVAIVPASVGYDRLIGAIRAVDSRERAIADRIARGLSIGDAFDIARLL